MRLAFQNPSRSKGISPNHPRSAISHPMVQRCTIPSQGNPRFFLRNDPPRNPFPLQPRMHFATQITHPDRPVMISTPPLNKTYTIPTSATAPQVKKKASKRDKMNRWIQERPWVDIGKVWISTAIWGTAIATHLTYAASHGFNFATTGATLLGMGLITYSAAIFNQIIEVKEDGLMKRTENRPLVKGRIPTTNAAIVGFFAGITGVSLLYAAAPMAGLVGAINLISYAFIYSKIKTMTSWNTTIGAICGALPTLIGPLAAGASITNPAIWFSFIFMWLWQYPHAMAVYQTTADQLDKAGIVMVPRSRMVSVSRMGVYGIDALFIATALATISQFSYKFSWAIFIAPALAAISYHLHDCTNTFAKQIDSNGRALPVNPAYGIEVKGFTPGVDYMKALWRPLGGAAIVSFFLLILN